MTGLIVESVLPGSLAEELDIRPGDRLLSVNGTPLCDIIDYSYHTSAADELLLELAKPDGEIWELDIEREPGEPLGLIFPAPTPARCANNCIFCFVHQLPPGLRRPLYVKDEDYRLSFLNGNYVTLANLKPTQLKRIITQRLSPLYISVHVTEPHLRATMLGKQGIPPIMDQLRMLAGGRIHMHTQVVLCPGVNDGKFLEQTVDDLAGLYPAVQSLAIVPLGLTRYRRNLPQLEPVDHDYAKRFLAIWQSRARSLGRRLGEPFLFLADEFYLKAGLPFPPLGDYGDLPQIENGVGMVPLFLRQARKTLRYARPLGSFRATVVTGVSAAGFVNEFLTELSFRTGLQLVAVAVENHLFGDSVTVSGLVAGSDIIAALKGHEIGTLLLLPDVMLKEGEGIFLDGISLDQLGKTLDCRVACFDGTPDDFYRTLQRV